MFKGQFFFGGGVHLHTVDGSEIRLTSWYGNHPIICRVFIHSRWLFGMSCINNYESPPYWDTPTFDRSCRCIACRRRRSFLLLQNLTPRCSRPICFLLKMFTWERTSNLEASLGGSKKERISEILLESLEMTNEDQFRCFRNPANQRRFAIYPIDLPRYMMHMYV